MIPIRNIYYMLSYSFNILNEQGYKKVACEKFDNVVELCAAILIKGVSNQLKRGLYKSYIETSDSLSILKGKIDITTSIKSNTLVNKQMSCVYDEFSSNVYMNRIIKTTMFYLIKSNISKVTKKKLKKLIIYFDDVDILDINIINWSHTFNKNNQTYRMLIGICNLIIKGLLQTTSDGTTKLMDFLDETKMHRLYEKFILEYYKQEHPDIKTTSSQIPWQLDDDINEMLPIMQSDIMLSKNNKVLIIDAKYYSKTLQCNYDKKSIHSANLYQIFTYVKNKELALKDSSTKVIGMLLYAKTNEQIVPNNEYMMSGNKIVVKTLDLDCDFNMIKEQLNGVVRDYLLL